MTRISKRSIKDSDSLKNSIHVTHSDEQKHAMLLRFRHGGMVDKLSIGKYVFRRFSVCLVMLLKRSINSRKPMHEPDLRWFGTCFPGRHFHGGKDAQLPDTPPGRCRTSEWVFFHGQEFAKVRKPDRAAKWAHQKFNQGRSKLSSSRWVNLSR